MTTHNSPSSGSSPSVQSPANATPPGYVPPTPLRCFTGALIAGGIGTALYSLTVSIHTAFANKPLPTVNLTATNIAIAVRTLVVGVSTLATAIFCIATLGLLALGVQLLFQKEQKT